MFLGFGNSVGSFFVWTVAFMCRNGGDGRERLARWGEVWRPFLDLGLIPNGGASEGNLNAVALAGQMAPRRGQGRQVAQPPQRGLMTIGANMEIQV
jgi:hypothetical protein